MSESIQGLNRLLSKLERLSRIDGEEGLVKAGEAMSKAIYAAAPKNTGRSREYIKASPVQKSPGRAQIKVGLKEFDGGTWQHWKGLYFQNYGYHNNGRGGIYRGKYVIKHVGWFDRGVDAGRPAAKIVLQGLLKEVKEAIG